MENRVLDYLAYLFDDFFLTADTRPIDLNQIVFDEDFRFAFWQFGENDSLIGVQDYLVPFFECRS